MRGGECGMANHSNVDRIKTKQKTHFIKNRYVFDGYCGTSPKSRKNVRIITELAWQHHFCKNMFIRPDTEAETEGFEPDFTIINACKVVNDDYKVILRVYFTHVW